MARYLSLKAHYKKLRRKYRKVTNFRYFYNNKSDLNPKLAFKEIVCWFLIHDEERGYSIFNFKFRRSQDFTIAEWRKRFTQTVAGYEPIMKVINQSVLPAINNKSGAEWRFITLIGWTGDAVSKIKSSNTSKQRRPTSKKKRGRKSNKHRR